MTVPNERIAYRAADAVLRTVLRRVPHSLGEQAALKWGYSYRPKPRTVRLRSGMLFRYERPDFIPILLNYTGTFEPGVIKIIRSLVHRGDTVLDVGANIGYHTLECWNAVGKKGRVISIEAMPKHAAAIKQNLLVNAIPPSNVINVAVGDHDGEVSLGLPEGGNEGMYGINAGSSDVSVPLRRIDDLLDVQSLALIKMDIEGSELGALKGAEQTIRKHRPAIVIELNETALARCGTTSGEVVRYLERLGYKGQTITAQGLRPLGAEHGCDECLFLRV